MYCQMHPFFYQEFADIFCACSMEHLLINKNENNKARLAQLVERKALNLVVVGSSPTVGDHFFSRADFFLFPF